MVHALHSFSGFEHIVESYLILSYTILFLGIVIEGEFFLIFSGILTHLHVFDIALVLPVIICAALVKTIIWYRVGRYIHKKVHNKYLQVIERKVLAFLPSFKNEPFWSIFSSKFIYGINHFVLIFSGIVGVPFKKYMLAEIYAGVFWLTGYFSLGYFFSYTAFSITKNIRLAFLILIGLIISVFILQKIISIVIDFFQEYNKK